MPSEDEFDDFLGDDVGEAEIHARDGDEPEHDGGRLRDLAAVGPLHALQLSPARTDERSRAVARGQRCARGAITRGFAAGTWPAGSAPVTDAAIARARTIARIGALVEAIFDVWLLL